MEYFYINKGSVNNTLRIELVRDGRFDFMKRNTYHNAIQNANVTFSMVDEDGILKVSKGQCDIVLSKEGGCDDTYIIEYKWKPRDVNKEGKFIGKFEITFNGDLYENGVDYPSGNLIVPIYEDLVIMVK